MADTADQVESFTSEAYAELISALTGRGYSVRGYGEVDPARPHLILRHDVDFDLAAAVRMAELEAEHGWKSHYFVLVRTEFYNPFSAAGKAHVRRLRELGHVVGLHFDASVYPADPDAIRDGVTTECGLLETVTGADVRLFSLHRPHQELLDHDLEVPGRINTYSPAFFRDIGYCSDSTGVWRHGHPLDHPEVAKGHALQLLTHPIWWFGRRDGPQRTLEAVLDHRGRILEDEAQEQCSAYTARSLLRR